MKPSRIGVSLLLAMLGWVSFVAHGAVKDYLIDQLGDGPLRTISLAQSFGIFISLSVSMAACAGFGIWLLVTSKERHSSLRPLAWTLHISYSIVLAMVWLVSGARP